MASSSDDNGGSFASFLEGWLVRQEHYLDELVSADLNCHESSDDDLRELVSRILAHYQQYYEEKSRIAARDVLRVFSPPWLTSLERAFLWIAGFKPGLAFRIVDDSVGDLSEDQARSVGRLAQKTRSEERALNDEIARIQESVAAPPLLGIAMRGGRRLVDGEQDEADSTLESLKAAMEAVLSAADSLRTTTALKIMEVLRPAQCVKFLLAAGQLQLRLRSWGLERE